MKSKMLAVLASLVLAVPISLTPTIQTIAEPTSIDTSTKSMDHTQSEMSLAEYMRTVYTTTEHPELDEYIFRAFKTIEDNKYSNTPVVVYTGDYEACRIFREYFNYAYGYTYEFRLTAYRTSRSEDFVVALCNVDNIEQSISNYRAEVQKAKAIATTLVAGDRTSTSNNIFNWVRSNIRYDYSLHGSSEDAMLKSYYGFYSGNQTICKGFSMAVYQLCSMNGIPATLETGTFNSGPHGWNTVTMDDGLKYVDVLNEQNMVSPYLPAGYVTY